MLFCIFITFLIIVFHILIDRKEVVKENEENPSSEKTWTGNTLTTENGFTVPQSTKQEQKPRWDLRKVFVLSTSSDFENLGRVVISVVIVAFNLIYWLDIFLGHKKQMQ